MVRFTYPLYLTILVLISSSSSADEPKTAVAEKEVFKARRPIVTMPKHYSQMVHYSNAFVDKSLFIKSVLETSRRVFLITCPKRWGKTLNLRMLEYFLQPELDTNGNPIQPLNETSNYLLFTKGEVLLMSGVVEKLKEPLLISKHKNIVENHLGKYPTIYVSFKNLNQTKNEYLFAAIRSRISDTFKEHCYVVTALNRTLNDPNITFDQKIETRRILDKFMKLLAAESDDIDLEESLAFLSKLLYKYYHAMVYILLDNWDCILYNVLYNKSPDVSQTDILEFLTKFYENSFKKNTYVRQGILAGTHMVKLLVPVLQNIFEYNVIFNDLHEFFGFSETEVHGLLTRFDFDQKLFPQVKEWYNGYHVGVNGSISLYNSRSVTNFLSKKVFAVYGHTDYELNRLLRDTLRYPQFRNILVALLVGKPAFLSPRHLSMDKTGLSHFRDTMALKKIPQAKLNHFTIQYVLAFLCTSGYLKFDTGSYALMQKSYQLNIVIPNESCRGRLANRFIVFLEANFGILPRARYIDKAAQSLIKYIYNFEQSSIEPLTESLTVIVQHVPYFKYNTEIKNKQYNEDFSNVLLHFIAERILRLYPLKIDKPFTYKRPILALYPFVSDFKALLTITVNASTPEDCLRTIKMHKNAFQFPENIRTIKYIGINIVSKNEVTICSDTESNEAFVEQPVHVEPAVLPPEEIPIEDNATEEIPKDDNPMY